MPNQTQAATSRHMQQIERHWYTRCHRIARIGNLGTLAMSLSEPQYQWFLTQVYDLRFPHIGSERHMNRRTFDSLRQGVRARRLNKRIAEVLAK
jgi:hypothetical protein